jgi:hypothetical protein
LLAFTFLTFSASLPTLAQVSDTGIDQFGTYQRNHIQAINLFNLNNHIEIPMTSKTARDLTYTAKYVWDLGDSFSRVLIPNNIVWQQNDNVSLNETGTAGYNSHIVSASQTCTQQYAGQASIIQFDSIYDNNGTAHAIPVGPTQDPQILVGPGCPPGTATFSTSDGWLLTLSYTNQTCSQYRCISSVAETDPAGNVHQPGNLTNPNGNQIIGTAGVGVTDSTGNTVLSAGPNNTLVYPVQGGGTATVQFYESVFNLPSTFGCISYQSAFSYSLPTGIGLPDGSQYSWVYESSTGSYPSTNVTGRIHSITVPAGGTYTYKYSGGTNGVNCNDGKPAVLSITGPDGDVWTYNRTPPAPAQLTQL